MADPHVQARDTFLTIDDEDLGPLQMQNLMFRMGHTPGQIRFAGRRLGQDNDTVYHDHLGIDAERLTELRDKGVI